MTRPLTGVVHFRLVTVLHSLLIFRANHLQHEGHLLVDHPPIQYPTVIISLNWPTLTGLQLMAMKSASRSTLPHSNVLYARKSSPVPIIFVPISVHTPMSVLLSAQFVAKHSLVNMIARDMKDYTVGKRSSSAEASSALEVAGAVAGDSPVQTHSAGISEARLVESASSLYWMKKPWSASASMTSK